MPFQSLTNDRTGSGTVTVANGASLSDAAALGPTRMVGVITPSALTTATTLSFQVSADGTTFADLLDQYGSEITAAVSTSAARGIAVDPSLFLAWPFVKVRTGTSAAPVNQGADRVFTLLGAIPT